MEHVALLPSSECMLCLGMNLTPPKRSMSDFLIRIVMMIYPIERYDLFNGGHIHFVSRPLNYRVSFRVALVWTMSILLIRSLENCIFSHIFGNNINLLLSRGSLLRPHWHQYRVSHFHLTVPLLISRWRWRLWHWSYPPQRIMDQKKIDPSREMNPAC